MAALRGRAGARSGSEDNPFIAGIIQREHRSRRSCLAVPGSNPRFLEKAKTQGVDQVFLDLEDACAPLAKPGARKNIVAALTTGDWSGKARVVRVNDLTTPWTYQDVIEIVTETGSGLCVDPCDPDAIAEAVDRLVDLIREHGKWVEPSEKEAEVVY